MSNWVRLVKRKKVKGKRKKRGISLWVIKCGLLSVFMVDIIGLWDIMGGMVGFRAADDEPETAGRK